MGKYTGSEVLDHIIDKFKQNSSLRVNLKRKLQQVTSQLYLNAQSATGFCYRFQIPHRLPEQLFTVYGVPAAKIKEAFKSIGFHTNRMYEDPYHQSMILLYLIGLYSDDEELKKIALFLDMVKLYNGMQYRYFKNGCKENVAEFVRRAKINNKSLLKTKNPLELIAHYIDTLDSKYSNEIKKDPDKMILRLFAQTWGRLNQVFRNIAQLYYDHVNDKDIDASIETMQKDDQGALKLEDNILHGTIDALVDKFDKAVAIRFPALPETEKQFLMKKLIMKPQAIDEIYKYLQTHPDLIKYQVSEVLIAANVKSENDIFKLPILHTIDKLLIRKNEVHTNNLKKSVDDSLTEIFGGALYNKISITQKLKLRKLYMYILFYCFQVVVGKMKQFERTIL